MSITPTQALDRLAINCPLYGPTAEGHQSSADLAVLRELIKRDDKLIDILQRIELWLGAGGGVKSRSDIRDEIREILEKVQS